MSYVSTDIKKIIAEIIENKTEKGAKRRKPESIQRLIQVEIRLREKNRFSGKYRN